MRIFMTGATGVIGRRVIPQCVQRGHQVTAIARSPEGLAAIERLGATAIVSDLFDRDRLATAMPGHDVVINLATHMPSSTIRMFLPGAWRENDRVRREGSATLVAAALAACVGRFIQESFAMIYRDNGDAWIDESSPIEPAAYNRTVVDAERAAQRFTEAGRIGIVLRFGAFYGPDGRFFADMVRMVNRGFSPLLGPADAYISSVSHDDAAAAVIAALGLPAGIYNVVDDEPLTHRECMNSLADALGVHHPRILPTWLTYFGGTPARVLARSLRMSNRKLEASSAWKPKFRSVREGWPSAIAPFIAEPRPPAHVAPTAPAR